MTACALRKDLKLFPCGDLTEIGEREINMSGGQKQWIQIARVVYHDADVYLLDDPFSAVDANTGTQLFKDCLMGVLKEKTIIYVTHQVEFLLHERWSFCPNHSLGSHIIPSTTNSQKLLDDVGLSNYKRERTKSWDEYRTSCVFSTCSWKFTRLAAAINIISS
ncbi:putative ABC transporter C family member 15 isoform X2 [Benincasa hispida]|uniref:putative ABC transporter C family member 15 isoform X2 n=1 Tax=Benincasa hispida TaxID=102211 RepID=UPI0018FFBEB7|nr:putative ABC transporter C family member 15 isoform X2 [Benincasa hispida]